MRITLQGRQRCHYHLAPEAAAGWCEERSGAGGAGRIGEFLHPLQLDPHTYVVEPRARLVGRALVGVAQGGRIVEETLHLQQLAGRQRRLAQLRSLLPPRERLDGAVVSLVDGRRWCDSYFHWFVDCLPRLLAAQHHQQRSGEPCRVIVPARLRPWQAHSLDLLGIPPQRRLSEPAVHGEGVKGAGGGGLEVEQLIASVAHRWQRLGEAPFDALSPWAIRWLARHLQQAAAAESGAGAHRAHGPMGGAEQRPTRLYLSRRGVPSRQVINEEEVQALLEPHGFVTLQPERLSLREQIALFQGASHIVAPHGAGLTNLLHCRGGWVLELFQQGHGLRPDFFQLACIQGLHYRHALCPSQGPEHHCQVPASVIEAFLAESL